DGTLFRKMLEDQKGPDVIARMIGLFHSLGIKTTIEGIETDQQRLEAITAGADELQGFFLKRPMAKEDLVQFVSKH
ncbi:MAG: EAL domain-containing protein, partial [Acholeplasmataceae bacterium]|nr:EAL domain-containing protein [Acholeplasmataceae bacterium]